MRVAVPIDTPIRRPERDFEWYEKLADMLTSIREHLFDKDTAKMAKVLGLRQKQLERLEKCDLRLADREADRLGAILRQIVDAHEGRGN